MKKIDIGVEKLEFIYHLSDIHIRNFKRHDEYRRVFRNVADYVKQDNRPNSVVIVTGDIVHSKTDVSPELVSEVQNFFRLMSETHHVIITTGNHDTNLKNADRLDAISPIVEAINSDRIHYLKDGGVYEFAGVHFCVWSVFDAPTQYIKAHEFEGEFKIATYHGTVDKALTDTGHVLSNSHMKVSDFEGYDFVLLGDIHKFQYLDEENKIAYCGSLIQQNHGESLDNHGMLLWDIKNKNSEFIPIENDTCYYTLYVNSGAYDVSNMPSQYSKMYLRIRHTNTSPSEIKSIISKIKQKYQVIEVSNQQIRHSENNSIDISKSSAHIDTRDIEYQNSIISSYLKSVKKLNKAEIDAIVDINRKINQSIQKIDQTKNSIWVPIRFEFENMFSYGKNNYVDFSKMEGTYGLFAENASGKTTLLDSIAFCLFDKCSKTFKGSHVINNESDSFWCKLTFELNSKQYTIHRSSIRQKSGNVRVEVDFYYTEKDGTVVSLNGKERSDTNANIRKVVGSYEDFILTTLSTQNGGLSFIDMNQKDRKELLCQFLDINVFEELYTVANTDQKEILTLLKEYNKTNYQEEYSKEEKNIEKYDSELSVYQSAKQEYDDIVTKKTQELLELSSLMVSYNGDIVLDIDDLSNKKKLIQDNIGELSSKLQVAESDLKENKSTLQNAESKLRLCVSDEEIKIGIDRYEDLNKKKQKSSIEFAKFQSELDSKKEKMDNLSNLKYDPNCKFCMDNIFVKDAIYASSSFCDSKSELESKKLELDKLTTEVSENLKYKLIKDEKLQLSSTISKLQKNISDNNVMIAKIEAKIKENNEYIKKIDDNIALYKNNEEAAEYNKKIKNTIEEIKTFISSIKSKQNEVATKIAELLSDRKLSVSKKEEYSNSINKIKKLEAESKNYQYYLEAVHRDGVPHSIITSILPKIEVEVNNILSQLVDFRVVFDADDKNINTYIAYDDNRFWPIELSSGMEKFVSSMAIRNSLINVSTLPRPDFIAIDEGFGVLSSHNLSSMPILFDYLKSQFRFILMVSHIEAMRDYVDNHLEIHKKNGRSIVQY